ncbi:MAG: hypothetical protein DHS80DRAFT_30922 [Piptocephalis tieghemiana]|nr:MAG: hypothetical protein DHS80DRAFT_30922 [Piptocephalis tieghemiana]
MNSTRRLTLTLYSSKTCSLCDTVKRTLGQVQKQVPFHLDQVDIHAPGNEQWLKYAFDIPVLHVNGRFLLQHRIDDEQALVRQLKQEDTITSSSSPPIPDPKQT